MGEVAHSVRVERVAGGFVVVVDPIPAGESHARAFDNGRAARGYARHLRAMRPWTLDTKGQANG